MLKKYALALGLIAVSVVLYASFGEKAIQQVLLIGRSFGLLGGLIMPPS